jgi:rhamnulokinase
MWVKGSGGDLGTLTEEGLAVVSGPVEAAALGNILVRARTAGAVEGDLPRLRAPAHRTRPLRRYRPRNDGAWDAATGRAIAGRAR